MCLDRNTLGILSESLYVGHPLPPEEEIWTYFTNCFVYVKGVSRIGFVEFQIRFFGYDGWIFISVRPLCL